MSARCTTHESCFASLHSQILPCGLMGDCPSYARFRILPDVAGHPVHFPYCFMSIVNLSHTLFRLLYSRKVCYFGCSQWYTVVFKRDAFLNYCIVRLFHTNFFLVFLCKCIISPASYGILCCLNLKRCKALPRLARPWVRPDLDFSLSSFSV